MHITRPSRRAAAAPSGSPDAHMCPGQGAQVIRAWEPGHRSVEVVVLTFRAWHVCARCHRKKKNQRETLRSGSELLSLSHRILLLVACRPRARVKRACAVGIARRGAQTGRLGSSCEAGQALVRTRHCEYTASDRNPPSLGARRPLGGFALGRAAERPARIRRGLLRGARTFAHNALCY